MLMTLSFTCRLVLTRLLIRLMLSLPWNAVYWTFVRSTKLPNLGFSIYTIFDVSGRKYLSQESARTLVHAFIIGRMDYCNSLLFGLPSVHLFKLQRLQNAAARLISNVPRHITPVLCSLHWLPVKFRIDFKILLLTFKAIYGHAPGYLIDLIAIKEQPRYNLRSASGLILKYPS